MRNGEWTNEELDFIKENYKTMTYREMGEKLGRTKTAIDLKVNRLGLKKSKYHYNKDFFETIDTEEKAYWLGFMYADGWVCVQKTETGNVRQGELGIQLQQSDSDHLRKFVKSIDGNIPVFLGDTICAISGNPAKFCLIRIYCTKMVEDLIKNGCIERKSKCIEFPTLREDLVRHFIRGFFDGDGCVCENKQRKCPRCDFCCASVKFIEALRTKLYEFGISSYICGLNGTQAALRLVIGGMKNVDMFMHFLYDDSTIFLDRKRNRFADIYGKYNVLERLPR